MSGAGSYPLKQSDASLWLQFVTQFDQADAEFSSDVSDLMSYQNFVTNQRPDLLPQYQQIVQKASQAQAKLESLRATRNTVASWLSDLANAVSPTTTGGVIGAVAAAPFGLSSFGAAAGNAANSVWSDISSGFNSVTNWVDKQFNLGAIGVVAGVVYVAFSAAVATAAVAAILYVIDDIKYWNARLSYAQQLQSQGYDAQQAAQLTDQTFGSGPSMGILSNLGQSLGLPTGLSPVLLIGGGIILLALALRK